MSLFDSAQGAEVRQAESKCQRMRTGQGCGKERGLKAETRLFEGKRITIKNKKRAPSLSTGPSLCLLLMCDYAAGVSSVFSKFPFSWHCGHFWGLHLPSLLNPQLLHFHVAINNSLLYLVLFSVISRTLPNAVSGWSNFFSSPTTTSFMASGCRYFLATLSTSSLVTRAMLSR
jgi:hypothetical protein